MSQSCMLPDPPDPCGHVNKRHSDQLSGIQTKLSKILLNGNNICMVCLSSNVYLSFTDFKLIVNTWRRGSSGNGFMMIHGVGSDHWMTCMECTQIKLYEWFISLIAEYKEIPIQLKHCWAQEFQSHLAATKILPLILININLWNKFQWSARLSFVTFVFRRFNNHIFWLIQFWPNLSEGPWVTEPFLPTSRSHPNFSSTSCKHYGFIFLAHTLQNHHPYSPILLFFLCRTWELRR